MNELKVKFDEIPSVGEIRTKVQDARLEYIQEQIEWAINKGDNYCWINDKFMDDQIRSLLEVKGYTVVYNFSDYQISW